MTLTAPRYEIRELREAKQFALFDTFTQEWVDPLIKMRRGEAVRAVTALNRAYRKTTA